MGPSIKGRNNVAGKRTKKKKKKKKRKLTSLYSDNITGVRNGTAKR
jgi:hypothetical protein